MLLLLSLLRKLNLLPQPAALAPCPLSAHRLHLKQCQQSVLPGCCCSGPSAAEEAQCSSRHTIAYGSPLFLQAELSLQKEQLQLKIIEVEDEVDKWQKERDRIKVRGGYSLFCLSYACLFLFQALTSLFLPSIFLAYPALTPFLS